MYTHIFFDLGLTLAYREREIRYQGIIKDFGIEKPIEEIKIAFHRADKLFFRDYPGILGESPKYHVGWYYGVLNYYLGIRIDLFELAEKLRTSSFDFKWKAFPFTLETLEKLKEMGYKLGLISNWDESCREVLKDTGIDKYLDYINISSEIGISKPDKRIFEYALNSAGVSPAECLYVGDNFYDDVRGCRQLNMDCYLINPPDKLGIEEIDYDKIITSIAQLLDILA